jgi:hypothetical protein
VQCDWRGEQVRNNFAFAFVDGALVRAVRDGAWLLLDEINLAPQDTLEGACVCVCMYVYTPARSQHSRHCSTVTISCSATRARCAQYADTVRSGCSRA